MADYDLYYWPIPFRGQFIRATLAYAGKQWREHDTGQIGALMGRDPASQPAPFTAPPLLVDLKADFALSQMPAIMLYLGETLALIPENAQARASTIKLVNDANDVIDEMTLDGGRMMWTDQTWEAFLPRLANWMTIWEATGQRHGLTPTQGFMLGTPEPGVADIVTHVLWSTMAERFEPVARLLADTAPLTAALSQRMQDLPPLADLRRQSFRDYGQAWCGGEIEKSLRAVMRL